jgi:Na+/H+ antiporter NhaA
MTLARSASDVVLPPTLVIDFLYLGFPVGIAAGAAILAAMVAVYLRLRRRGRGRAFSALMAGVVLAGCNLAIYLFWLKVLWESPSRRRHHEVTLPVATAMPVDGGGSDGGAVGP